MTAYATELDLCPAFGWQGGPEFNTRVVMLKNGQERRNANWAQMRHHFTLPYQNITDAAYLAHLKSVFLAVRGMTHSFLVKDASDHLATGESLGVAPSGSTAVQLVKTYTFGSASYTRTIRKPVSVTLYQANGSGVPTLKAGSFDAATGLFTPSSGWTAGRALTWSGEFRVPVRFASDIMQMSIDSRSGANYAMNGSVELLEVFGE